MAAHKCVACAHYDRAGKKRPRPVVNQRSPLWCATHWNIRKHLRHLVTSGGMKR